MRLFLFVVVFLSSILRLSGQDSDSDLIQFSGYTLMGTSDSIEPAPFILIKNKSRNSGSYSNPDGFFSLVVKKGDVVEFTSVGFKKSTLIIPDNISSNKFTANQIMVREVQRLPETVIVPWKSLDELKQAFLDLKVSDDDLIIAYQNMQYERWVTLREKMPLSAYEAQTNAITQQGTDNRIYRSNLLPQNNLLNPLAWYQFINYLQNTKKKKKESDVKYKYEDKEE